MLKPIPELVAAICADIRVITAAQAALEMAENNGVTIDVREPSEVSEKPAPNSINIPRGVLEMKMSQAYPNSEQPIYIHCASGARAALSAEQLQRIGYCHVTAISCGIDDVCAVG